MKNVQEYLKNPNDAGLKKGFEKFSDELCEKATKENPTEIDIKTLAKEVAKNQKK